MTVCKPLAQLWRNRFSKRVHQHCHNFIHKINIVIISSSGSSRTSGISNIVIIIMII